MKQLLLTSSVGVILGLSNYIAYNLGQDLGYAERDNQMHVKCTKTSYLKFEGDNSVYGCATVAPDPNVRRGRPAPKQQGLNYDTI